MFTFPFTWVPFLDKFHIQVISRFILSLFVISGFNSFANAVGRKYGTTTRRCLIVLTLTQFHFTFYLSRPLPNTYALGLTLWALSRWILQDFASFTFLIAQIVVIFRFETAILFGCIILFELIITRQMKVTTLLAIGIPSGLFALTVTVLFDSFMWAKWIWPEGHGLYFNLYLNKSNEWGTLPFFWYFYSALPRALLASIFLIPFATKRCLKNFFSVSMAFVFLYSFLPHKELRFILYIVPMLNVCAGSTLAIVVDKFEGTKPSLESYFGNKLLRAFGYEVPLDDEAADRERDIREKEIEEEKERRRKINELPAQYDALSPSTAAQYPLVTNSTSSSGHLVKRKDRPDRRFTGIEAQLDEQYSKITAAVLEKHKPLEDNSRRPSFDSTDDESNNLSCATFAMIIIMALHLWCNFGLTCYASLTAWHNYPGGDAICSLNSHIISHDLTHGNRYRANEIGVHVSNLAAQTGFSRFLQLDKITYDKSPNLEMVVSKSGYELGMKKLSNSKLYTGKSFSPEDFSKMKLVYLVLENIDLQMLQKHCSSLPVANKASKLNHHHQHHHHQGMQNFNPDGSNDNVICNFGDYAKNCKMFKIINGFGGIEFALVHRNNLILKTSPMLWVFRCVNYGLALSA